MTDNENILLKDLVFPKTISMQKLENIKQEALKQISRCKYTVLDGECIVEVMLEDKKYKVLVTNDLDSQDFFKALYTVIPIERSVLYMREKRYEFNGDLIQILSAYKEKYYRVADSFDKDYWIKLYSDKPLQDPYRKLYNAGWINYEEQLKQSENIIYDSNAVCGIWAMDSRYCHKVFEEECNNHYGDKVFIVELVDGEYYFSDGAEIIGDKYKVLESFDLRTARGRTDYVEFIMKNAIDKCESRISQYKKDLVDTNNDLAYFECELERVSQYCSQLENVNRKGQVLVLGVVIVGIVFEVLRGLLF